MSNTVVIAGRIGKDAEIRALPDGTPIVSFTLADSYYSKGQQATNWWDCSGFGQRYEKLAGYLTKGAQVTIFGTLTTDEYVDREGAKRKAIRLRLNDIALQGGHSVPTSGQAAPVPPKAVKKAPAPQPDLIEDEADVPF